MKLNQLAMTMLAVAVMAAAQTPTPALAADPCKCPDPPSPAQPCPRSVHYWKAHFKHTEVQTLRLGREVYSRAEIQELLRMKDRGDQSIVLAQQLAAAKLNRLRGCDVRLIEPTCVQAHTLLRRPGRLPYQLAFPKPRALKMAQAAAALEIFNEGKLTPDCTKTHK
jgi:hypothetical protein